MMICSINRLYRSAFWVALLLLAPVSILHADDDNGVLAGDEVTGKNVVAVWQFKPGAELTDGKGDAELTLKGDARVVEDERFGGVLDCPGTPKGEDKPHGAFTKWNPDVAVDGPFTVEAWVKLKEKPADPKWRSGYIVDKTYVPRTHKSEKLNKDFFFKIARDAGGTRIRLQGGVGLGNEVIGFTSDQVPYQPGTWQHMVFCYNGAGTGMFFLDGKLIGKKTYPGKGGAAKGTRWLSIGDRSGSLYNGLPGYIAQVRITRGLPEMVSLIDVEVDQQFGRTAFERMETDVEVRVTLKSVDGRIINGVTLNVDDGIGSKDILVGELSAKPRTVTVPVRTDGRAGAYTLEVTAAGQLKDEKARGAAAYKYHLCNRLPEYMPIVMWGGASFEKMEQTGFTHYLQWMDHVDYQAWKEGEPIGFVSRFDDVRDKADEALVRGLRLMGKISPGGYFKHQKTYAEARKDYLVYDRLGKPGNVVDFSLPRVQQFGFDVGRSVANNVGMFPSVDLVIADSEFRDAGRLSFRPETRDAFRKHAGIDIPKDVKSKTGVKYNRLPDFPRDRVIADDNPILVYYKWLWGGG
ncbi:MAG: LamG-like jellyroll fold domain-containing protein, partial [Planctomycetota bacterium]